MKNYLLVIALLLCGHSLTAQTHPFFDTKENSGAMAQAARLVDEYSEAQWLALVPTQAPRNFGFCPNHAAHAKQSDKTNWNWSPSDPDRITCLDCNTTYPNDKFPATYADVEVMSGKKVKVPYYTTPKGTTYVQALIDNAKTAFIKKNIPLLGALYINKGDERYARYVALALDKWADAVPDYFMTEGWNRTRIVTPDELPRKAGKALVAHRASDHNGLAAEIHDKEVLAFDRIYHSKALKDLSKQRGYDVRKHIMNDLFLNLVLWMKDYQDMDVHASTNLIGYIGVMTRVAAMCEDEMIREDIMDFVGRYYKIAFDRNFNRDAMYPESFAYHRGYAQGNYNNINKTMEYFAIRAAKTPRMKEIFNSLTQLKTFSQKSMLAHLLVSFPNGDDAPFDDTNMGRGVKRDETSSHLLATYQHGMIGDGKGANQIQSNVAANDKANHVGSGMMSMTLFANGKEQIGDIAYSRLPGRKYTNSTLAHNTVVVDGEQFSYFSPARQVFGNVGHVFTNGYFSLFEPNLDGVSVMEVYNNTLDVGVVKRYQRLQLLNTIDINTPYLVDIFVVEGGGRHEYLLHGSTQTDQQWSSSLPTKKIDAKFPMLEAGQKYTDPVYDNDDRNWYGVFRDMSKATVEKPWSVTYKELDGKTSVRTWGIDNQPSQIFIGRSPVPTRRETGKSLYEYWRPSMIERRESDKSLFVHVIEPFKGERGAIKSVEPIELKESSDEFVALCVSFNDGREDIVLINMNEPLVNGQEPTQTITTKDNAYAMTGKLGLITTPAKGKAKGYMVGSSKLTCNGKSITNDNSLLSGTISAVERKADGAVADAFVVEGIDVAAAQMSFPRWVRVRFGTYNIIEPPKNFNQGKTTTQTDMNELFEITAMEVRDGKSYFICKDDPYLIVDAKGAVEIMRPQREFSGATQLRVQKSKVAEFAK